MHHLKFEESTNEEFSKAALDELEKTLGVTFPKSYVDLMKQWNGGNFDGAYIIKVPGVVPDELRYYLGDEGFWEINSICGITLDPTGHHSMAYTIGCAKEWELPDKVIPLDGDGHTWVALDYREQRDPSVVFIESNGCKSFVLANSFSEFLGSLIPYDQVYDNNGNVIYK